MVPCNQDIFVHFISFYFFLNSCYLTINSSDIYLISDGECAATVFDSYSCYLRQYPFSIPGFSFNVYYKWFVTEGCAYRRSFFFR